MAIITISEPTAASPPHYELTNPATLEPIGGFDATSPAQVSAAIEIARKAQPGWAARSPSERAIHLDRLRKLLIARTDEIMTTIARETGKPDMECLSEVIAACDALQYYAKHAAKILRDESIRAHLFFPFKKLVKSYHPKGVIGVITPWNFPFTNSVSPCSQALIAGNSVILKPSEVCPFSARLFGDLSTEAGFPEGVLQVLLGDSRTGAALCEGGVDKIHFTGSVRTGRIIGEVCGRNLIPVTLELGGKDPAIVCHDADLERAIPGVVSGALLNTGQVCASTERVYVVHSVYDRFVEGVVKEVKALRQSASGEADVSCMIWDAQLRIVETQLQDAIAKGAKVLTGGKRLQASEGLFLEPTVLTDVDHGMSIMAEETFGPVLPIMRVKDEEEAIRLANDSPYGLSASVWAGDRERGLTIANRLDCGSAGVNDFGGNASAAHEGSFGGSKDSGIGYANGELGLRSFCQCQHVIVRRFGPKREQNWFPYTAKTVGQMKGFMKFFFGTAIGRWLT